MEWSNGAVRIAYERAGKGKPLLLLHGWGDGKVRFDVFWDAFVARGNDVIALDFPGHGDSSLPPEPWSVTEYADMTLAFLDDLGVETCDIIAHSFGARVAICMASHAPQRFDKLLLTGAAGMIPKRGPDYYLRVYAYKLGKHVAKIPWLGKALGLDAKMRSAGSSDYQSLDGVMRSTFVKVVNQDLRPLLPSIQAPTLLVWGEYDAATPLWMGRVMEAEIPDAALVLFEGASHYAFVEHSRRFFSIADAFLWK